MSTNDQRMQRPTSDVDSLRCNGCVRNGIYSDCTEALGTSSDTHCPVVSTFVEVVGENTKETNKETRIRMIEYVRTLVDLHFCGFGRR